MLSFHADSLMLLTLLDLCGPAGLLTTALTTFSQWSGRVPEIVCLRCLASKSLPGNRRFRTRARGVLDQLEQCGHPVGMINEKRML